MMCSSDRLDAVAANLPRGVAHGDDSDRDVSGT